MLRKYPLGLAALAVMERMPVAAVSDAFDMTQSEVMADIVLFRDLLVSRAREAGLVSKDWSPSSPRIAAALRELSLAIAANWSSLLTPREQEERMHVYAVIRVIKKRYYQTQQEFHYG